MTDGLKTGERVIVEGIQKALPGGNRKCGGAGHKFGEARGERVIGLWRNSSFTILSSLSSFH